MTYPDVQWRIINTDTESPSGIAAVCKSPDHPQDDLGNFGVYDCCPDPQVEVWDANLAEYMVEALNGTEDYDLDPAALKWAREKVQFYVDKAERFAREAESASHRQESSGKWKFAARYMRHSLLTGEGCTIGPFDHRLPDLGKTMKKIEQLKLNEEK